jgi:hypothetical protein
MLPHPNSMEARPSERLHGTSRPSFSLAYCGLMGKNRLNKTPCTVSQEGVVLNPGENAMSLNPGDD